MPASSGLVRSFTRGCSRLVIKLRRLLRELNLPGNEARILGGVFTQVMWKLGQKLSTTCQM